MERSRYNLLFTEVHGRRRKNNRPKLKQGKFQLYIRKKVFYEHVGLLEHTFQRSSLHSWKVLEQTAQSSEQTGLISQPNLLRAEGWTRELFYYSLLSAQLCDSPSSTERGLFPPELRHFNTSLTEPSVWYFFASRDATVLHLFRG